MWHWWQFYVAALAGVHAFEHCCAQNRVKSREGIGVWLTEARIERKRDAGRLAATSSGGSGAAHAEEAVAGVGVGSYGPGEVPGHGPELLHGSGDTEVRQGGWSTAARSSAPAQRIRRHW